MSPAQQKAGAAAAGMTAPAQQPLLQDQASSSWDAAAATISRLWMRRPAAAALCHTHRLAVCVFSVPACPPVVRPPPKKQHQKPTQQGALVDFENVVAMEPRNYVGDNLSRVTPILPVTHYNIACCYSMLKQVGGDAGVVVSGGGALGAGGAEVVWGCACVGRHSIELTTAARL